MKRLVFDASLQALDFLVHPANEYLQDGQRIVSVCCDLAMRGLIDFPALKGLHGVAQGQQRATLGRTGRRIIYNTLKGLHKKKYSRLNHSALKQ